MRRIKPCFSAHRVSARRRPHRSPRANSVGPKLAERTERDLKDKVGGIVIRASDGALDALVRLALRKAAK